MKTFVSVVKAQEKIMTEKKLYLKDLLSRGQCIYFICMCRANFVVPTQCFGVCNRYFAIECTLITDAGKK